jgi:hypothetical protein
MQQPRATVAFSNPIPFSCTPDAHMCGECPALLHPHASASSQPSMFTRASQSTLHPMSFGQATSVQRRMVAGGKIMDFAASQVSHGRGPFAQEPVPAPVSNRTDFTAHSQPPHAFSGSCETVQEDGLLVCLLFFLHTHGFLPMHSLRVHFGANQVGVRKTLILPFTIKIESCSFTVAPECSTCSLSAEDAFRKESL